MSSDSWNLLAKILGTPEPPKPPTKPEQPAEPDSKAEPESKDSKSAADETDKPAEDPAADEVMSALTSAVDKDSLPGFGTSAVTQTWKT